MDLSIAIIDDHVLFRQGLKGLLAGEPDMKIVLEASDAQEAYPLIASLKPDVAILDVALPGVSGISMTREIVRRDRKTRVLILSMHSSEEYVVQALGAGATGYALKNQEVDQVIEAIRTVASDKVYLAPTIPRAVLTEHDRRSKRGGSREPIEELSPREREIFDMIVRNHSNRTIASHLTISIKTVETHRVSINRKLGVHSTAELVRFAALHGLLHA
jgi:DNA-binding NarL/FixJ family response regulator